MLIVIPRGVLAPGYPNPRPTPPPQPRAQQGKKGWHPCLCPDRESLALALHQEDHTQSPGVGKLGGESDEQRCEGR